MKKSVWLGILAVLGLGINFATTNVVNAKSTQFQSTDLVTKSTNKRNNHPLKGVNSKKYYVNFRYWGLTDKQQHDHKPVSKVLGNLHWIKGINPQGLIVYKSAHITKKNEITKIDQFNTNDIVKLVYGKGYKANTPVPVIGIVKYKNQTAFKTFDGVYVTANRKQVREINYYHHKY